MPTEDNYVEAATYMIPDERVALHPANALHLAMRRMVPLVWRVVVEDLRGRELESFMQSVWWTATQQAQVH